MTLGASAGIAVALWHLVIFIHFFAALIDCIREAGTYGISIPDNPLCDIVWSELCSGTQRNDVVSNCPGDSSVSISERMYRNKPE